jgi:hypothetical protein
MNNLSENEEISRKEKVSNFLFSGKFALKLYNQKNQKMLLKLP